MQSSSLAGYFRSRFSNRALWLGLTSLPLVVGCGSSTEHPDVLAQHMAPIAGGQFDPDHTSVVGMYTQQGQWGGMCTGTLIAPNLVLTARHCVASAPGTDQGVICGQSTFNAPYPAANMYFTNDLQMSQNGEWYRGREVRVPVEGDDICGFDVALVILQGQGVPANVTVPYIPRIDLEVVPGEEYKAIGYGSTGLGGGGGRKILGGLTVQCAPGYCGGYVKSTEFRGDTGICQGDSGGPAIDLAGKVIGVVSRGAEGCQTPVYGAVSAWKTWLMKAAVDAAALGNYPPPFWALSGSSDPEAPGTGGAAGAGGDGGAGGSGAAGAGASGGSGGASGGNTQGGACNGNQPCAAGYQCIVDPVSGGAPHCSASCTGNASCGAGMECATDVGVCVDKAADPAQAESSEQSSGCSISVESRGPAKPVPWIVAGLLLGLGGLRRRPRNPWSRGGSNP